MRYPKRESFFAHRFVRLLTKAAAAQELGPEAAWLLAVVAHTEDAKRYTGAVTFWNDQLRIVCGFGSPKRLIASRQRAIDLQWLHYEAGGKGKVGRYWCLVPERYEVLPDGPVDEDLQFRIGTANGTANNGSGNESELKGVQKRNSKGAPFYPSPNPKEGKPAGAGALSADLEEVLTAWNQSGLTRCRKLTDKRRSALRSRLADADWKADWREALDRAEKSSFCRGENERGWRADLAWFLKQDTVNELLEGKFDNRSGRAGQRGAAAADDVMAKHTAEVLAQKRAEAANGGPTS